MYKAIRFGTRIGDRIDVYVEVVDDEGLVDGRQARHLGAMHWEREPRYWSPDNKLICKMARPEMRSYRARQIGDFKIFIAAAQCLRLL